MARRALVMLAASVAVLTGGGAAEAKPRPLPDTSLGIGAGPVVFRVGERWFTDFARVTAHEDWFLHLDGAAGCASCPTRDR